MALDKARLRRSPLVQIWLLTRTVQIWFNQVVRRTPIECSEASEAVARGPAPHPAQSGHRPSSLVAQCRSCARITLTRSVGGSPEEKPGHDGIKPGGRNRDTWRNSAMRIRLAGIAFASMLLAAACGNTSPTTAPAASQPAGASAPASAAAASQAAAPVNLTLRYCWGGDAEMAGDAEGGRQVERREPRHPGQGHRRLDRRRGSHGRGRRRQSAGHGHHVRQQRGGGLCP